MRVIDIIIHPDYMEDGQSNQFLNGTDIAFAVVEIPFEKYRSFNKDEKTKF